MPMLTERQKQALSCTCACHRSRTAAETMPTDEHTATCQHACLLMPEPI